MARCTFMGHLIEEDKCPACGGAGYPLNVRRDMQMPRLYTLSMAVVPAPDVRLTVRWECSPCALEWETEEQEGQIATRVRSRVWSVLPSLNPAAKPLAIPADLIPPIPEPEPPEPPRVINGSVIGYRAWRIVDWQLYGTGVNRAWEPGVQQATCDTGPNPFLGSLVSGHSAPAMNCHCGINALARFDQGDSHWKNADVFGAIEAWGETDGDPETEHGGFHLHRNGFRARYAKVVLLAVEDDWPAAKRAAVRALAREHEADVCKREHLEDAAKEHGQLVPDEMLEWVSKTEGRDDVRKPGICQTLGYPGPPANPTTKYRKGQRVADSKAVIWTCTKGGKPGLWEREA